ncbi:MAG: aminotransferase class V-fold PLP-dependent enzyme [Vicinamibacterales bacterium]|nr:aminotransferase class V-fold PLP-dependent enzyme [Vicinamibacterales bacterium]
MPASERAFLDALMRVATLAMSRREAPLGAPQPVAEIAAAIPLDPPRDGIPFDEVVSRLEAIVARSVNTASPRFHNQLFSGLQPVALVGDFVGTLLNTTMATWEASPAATAVELALLARLCRVTGFEHGDGTFTDGGSESNLLALLAARHRACPAIRESGRWPDRPLVAFVSADAHYSVATAAQAAGIGLANVERIPVDARGRMRPEALAAALASARARGARPFFVCATAGTTFRGSVDPIGAIAEVCRGEDVWLHVDACLGAPALLSPRHRHLLEDVRQADSVVWDAHKLIGVPLTCSALIVREAGRLEAACAPDGAAYLYHGDGDPDLGRRGLKCARRVGALKLWATWMHLGDAGLAARIERLFERAAFAAALIRDTPGLALAAPVETVAVCFRPAAPDGVDAGALTRQVRARLLADGDAFLNYGPLEGVDTLRLLVSNPEVSDADLRAVVDASARARLAVLELVETP